MSEYIIRTTNMPEHILEAVSAWYEIDCEIVRCRDCKYSCEDRRDTSIGWVDVFVCDSEQWSTASLMPSHKVETDGFCKWGERRSE